MSTVSETLHALYAVQQKDTLLQRTKKAQVALDNGTAAAAASTEASAEAARRTAAAHTLMGELKDNELKLETLETKRKNYQQKLYQGSVTNARELANMEKEIDMMGRQRSDLDGRVLELMEETEEAREAQTVAEAHAKQAEEHHKQIVAAYQARYATLDQEMVGLNTERQAAAAQVEDLSALKRYETLRSKLAGVGIARIEDGACGGCHMTLSSTVIKTVKEYAAIQTCENCGRMLLT